MPYTENNGVKISWEERGGGDPLLLIMGLGYPSDMWYRTVPVVSRHYRTITFDNRGVGRSDSPAGPYSISQMASDAAAVLDAAGIDRAHVFGVSMGGMIAQEFALTYPSRLRSLILGCTAPGGPNAVRADNEVIEVLMQRGNMSPEEGVRAAVPFIYDPATPRERVEEDLKVRLRAYPSAASYFAQIDGIMKFEAYSRLAQINGPTLVIHGHHDRLVPPGNGELIANRIPGAKLVMLKDASHIFVTDQPDAAHRAVLSFLSEASSSAAN